MGRSEGTFMLIIKSIESFSWANELNRLGNPTHQVELLNKTILNIISNFIPNEKKTMRPKEPPWFTNDIKRRLKKHIHSKIQGAQTPKIDVFAKNFL